MISAPTVTLANEGVLMVVKGDIKVTQAASNSTVAARVGMKVAAGDSLRSGKDSRAKVVMKDKNVLNLSPDSSITITKYENNADGTKNVEINVKFGKVRASVEQKYDGNKSKFMIKTPTAVAGVRGTDFLTGYDLRNNRSEVITFSGAVAVGSLGPGGQMMNPVFVSAGQTTSVGAGANPAPPAAVATNELQRMEKDSSATPTSSSEERTPAANPSQEPSPNKENSDASPTDRPESSTNSREPASTPAANPNSSPSPGASEPNDASRTSGSPAPSNSMIRSQDLGPAAASGGGVPRGPASIMPPILPPQMDSNFIRNPLLDPSLNQYINDAIRTGPVRTTITVTPN